MARAASQTGPGGADSSRAEPGWDEPSRAEPGLAEPNGPEPSQDEPSRAEPSQSRAGPSLRKAERTPSKIHIFCPAALMNKLV